MPQIVKLYHPYPWVIEEAWPWERILAEYDRRASRDASRWLPFRDLARGIAMAPYRPWLHGAAGFEAFYCYGYSPFAYGHEMLMLKWSPSDHSLIFTYQEDPFGKPWKKGCVSDELLSVFEHIVTNRLKWVPSLYTNRQGRGRKVEGPFF